MRRLWPLTLSIVLVGCATSDALMPLKAGNTWVYENSTPIGKNVHTMKVVGPAAVGADQGQELRSESGETDLAWSEGALRASRLAGTTFDPPIVLLKEGGAKATWNWVGKVRTPLGVFDGRAAGSAVPEERLVAGRKAKTTQVTLTLDLPGQHIETISWYERGIGMVGQEQRNNGALVTKLQYISGP